MNKTFSFKVVKDKVLALFGRQPKPISRDAVMTVQKPQGINLNDMVLRGQTDGLYPAYDPRTIRRGEFAVADLLTYPGTSHKTDMVGNAIREQAMKIEDPAERKKYLDNYLRSLGVVDDFDAEDFLKRYQHLFADAMPDIGAIDLNVPAPVIVIDSIPDERPTRVLVAGSGMSRHMATGLVAALVARTPDVVLLDALTPSADNMAEMLKNISVAQESPLPRERSWVEMNQPFQRKRKRARAGRKFGKS